MTPTTRSRRTSGNVSLSRGLDTNAAIPFTASAEDYGLFSRLPLELRLYIWRFTLLLEYNSISQEPVLVDSRMVQRLKNGTFSIKSSDDESEDGADGDDEDDDEEIEAELIMPSRRYTLAALYTWIYATVDEQSNLSRSV
jgi:hypothetical protein